MKYNKLVRDKIPEIIKQKGDNSIIHIASEQEYWQKLKEKLTEEISEFNIAESQEEIADIYEVLDAICEFRKFDKANIEETKIKKAQERGVFKKRIILEEA